MSCADLRSFVTPELNHASHLGSEDYKSRRVYYEQAGFINVFVLKTSLRALQGLLCNMEGVLGTDFHPGMAG